MGNTCYGTEAHDTVPVDGNQHGISVWLRAGASGDNVGCLVRSPDFPALLVRLGEQNLGEENGLCFVLIRDDDDAKKAKREADTKTSREEWIKMDEAAQAKLKETSHSALMKVIQLRVPSPLLVQKDHILAEYKKSLEAWNVIAAKNESEYGASKAQSDAWNECQSALQLKKQLEDATTDIEGALDNLVCHTEQVCTVGLPSDTSCPGCSRRRHVTLALSTNDFRCGTFLT
eukprot:SAG11_NODE_3598_length_2347_cov_2.962189_2_plen_231_part_00